MHDAPFSSSFERVPPASPAQPYLDWARVTDFSYLRKAQWLPLLVEFNPKALPPDPKQTPLQVFATRKWLNDKPHLLNDEFVVPEVFEKKLPKVLARSHTLTFCVVLVNLKKEGNLQKLTSSDAWKQTILSAHLGPPVDVPTLPKSPKFVTSTTPPPPSGSSPAPAAPPPAQGSPSPGSATGSSSPIQRVVIAVIDQGIAFANSRFEFAGSSRIEYLWQQDFLGFTMPSSGAVMSNTSGVELKGSDINYERTAARAIGAGDEWIYRKIGGLDFVVDGFKPLARRRAHGTHVLDLAAANQVPAQHPIIAVDMPEDAVGDPAGSTLSVHAAWGLIYILSRAELLLSQLKLQTLPVVANLSYGMHEGPHDGTGEFERFMDQIVQACAASATPLAVVLAAGNFRQSRTHARVHVPSGTTKKLHWRLQPGGLTPSMMEIWLPPNAGSNVTVTLRPPQGSPISVSAKKPNDELPSGLPNGKTLYWAQYVDQTTVPPGTVPNPWVTVRAHVVLAIARTAMDPTSTWGDVVAPSGQWIVEINSDHDIDLQAWIKRSDTLSGRRAKGRQSFFDDPEYQRHMPNGRPWDYDEQPNGSYVSRMQSFSGIATGEKTHVIGGYCVSERYPAIYTSHGTRKLWNIGTGPSWLEPSDDSTICRGVLATGTFSGSTIAMNGSSVAAPQATRRIADEWLAKQTLPPFPLGAYVPFPPAAKERPIPAGEVGYAFGGGLLDAPRRKVPRL